MTFDLTQEQQLVADEILKWAKTPGSFLGLSGPAGSGKTTLLRFILPALADIFTNIVWTAMTGKAAFRLRQVIEQETTTFHKAFYVPPEDAPGAPSFTVVNEAPAEGTLLVIDEASMVTPEIYAQIKAEWALTGVKVLFVGDGFQLPPILSKEEQKIHGDDFTIFAKVPTASLTTVMRNGDGILAAATAIRERGIVTKESGGGYTYLRGGIYSYAVGSYCKNPSGLALITWRNEVRMLANAMIRRQLAREDSLPEPGEPILFCRNGWGRLNGEMQVVRSIEPYRGFGTIQTYLLTCEDGKKSVVTTCGDKLPMDGTAPFIADRSDWNAYKAELRRAGRDGRALPEPVPITWGYVLTAHKAQGSEFDHVMVFLADSDTTNYVMQKPSMLPNGTRVPFWRRWVYTSLTRAKKSAAFVTGEER